MFNTPGLGRRSCCKDFGDNDVSIENSVAIYGNTVYFANSGGLVQGWDISGLKAGEPRRGCSGSGPATTPTPRSSSTSDGILYVGSE